MLFLGLVGLVLAFVFCSVNLIMLRGICSFCLGWTPPFRDSGDMKLFRPNKGFVGYLACGLLSLSTLGLKAIDWLVGLLTGLKSLRASVLSFLAVIYGLLLPFKG